MSKRAGRDPFFIEGNKGGSYVRIAATDRPDVVRLEVGHDCVVRFDREINVWAFAAILTQANEDGFENVLNKGFGGDPLPEWAKPW